LSGSLKIFRPQLSDAAVAPDSGLRNGRGAKSTMKELDEQSIPAAGGQGLRGGKGLPSAMALSIPLQIDLKPKPTGECSAESLFRTTLNSSKRWNFRSLRTLSAPTFNRGVAL